VREHKRRDRRAANAENAAETLPESQKAAEPVLGHRAGDEVEPGGEGQPAAAQRQQDHDEEEDEERVWIGLREEHGGNRKREIRHALQYGQAQNQGQRMASSLDEWGDKELRSIKAERTQRANQRDGGVVGGKLMDEERQDDIG
jgi:hypothetical protein